MKPTLETLRLIVDYAMLVAILPAYLVALAVCMALTPDAKDD